MLWKVVCDGCNRYLCKSGAVGKRLDAVEDSETIATFNTRDFASAIAESQGWKSLSQGEIFCPECTAPKTNSRESVLAKIDAVLADEDLYETGEPRPSPQTVDLVRSLINGAVDPKRRIPKAEVSVYFGELDVTWKHRNRLLRLVAFRDSARRPVLYTQTDGSEALTRGHSIEVTGNDDLSNALDWLLA